MDTEYNDGAVLHYVDFSKVSFVLLSRYNNSVGRIIINSYFIGFTHFVRTIMMALLMMSPMALILIYPAATPVIMVIGLALSGYLQTFLFIKVFEGLEQSQTDGENAYPYGWYR